MTNTNFSCKAGRGRWSREVLTPYRRVTTLTFALLRYSVAISEEKATKFRNVFSLGEGSRRGVLRNQSFSQQQVPFHETEFRYASATTDAIIFSLVDTPAASSLRTWQIGKGLVVRLAWEIIFPFVSREVPANHDAS